MATKKMLSLALVTAILQKIGEWIKTEPEEIPAGTITKKIMRLVLGSKSLPPAIDKGFEMILRSRWTKDRPGQEEIFSALRTITVPLDSWINLVMDRKEACDDGNRMATEAELSGMAFGRIDGMNMVELQKIGSVIEARLAEVSEAYAAFKLAEAVEPTESPDVVRAKKAHIRACGDIVKNIHHIGRKQELTAGVDVSMALEAIQQRNRLLQDMFDRLVDARDYKPVIVYLLPSKSWIDPYRVEVVKAANPVAKPAQVRPVIDKPFVPTTQQVAAQAGQDVRKKVEPEVPYENLDLFGKCQWLERKCAALGKPVNKGKLVSRGMQQVNLEKRRAAMLAQVAELERASATAPKLGPLRERRAAVLAKAVQIGRKLEGEALAALEVKDTMSDAEITGLEILLTQWEKTLLDEEKRARRQVPVKSSPVPVVSVADARDVADALRSQREQIALPTIEESSAGRVLVSLMDAGDQNGKGKSN